MFLTMLAFVFCSRCNQQCSLRRVDPSMGRGRSMFFSIISRSAAPQALPLRLR